MTKAGFALTHPLRVARLSSKVATTFDLAPDATLRAALAKDLGISAIKKLSFRGTLMPVGRHDFTLHARVIAQVVQPCVVSLQPVVTDLADDVVRRFVRDFTEPTADEAEVPGDDTVEALPEVIDIGTVAGEALALLLPEYPRAAGAVFVPLHDATARGDADASARPKPFAGLAELAARMALKTPETGEKG